jgi:hypothetical protein
MRNTVTAKSLAEEEAHMDERTTGVLVSDVSHIKVTLTELKTDVRDLRGKAEAANEAIANLNVAISDIKGEFAVALEKASSENRLALERTLGQVTAVMEKHTGETRAAMEKHAGETRAAIEKHTGETRAAMEKHAGETRAAIEKHFGETKVAIAYLKVWVLVTLGTALGGVIGAVTALAAVFGHKP